MYSGDPPQFEDHNMFAALEKEKAEGRETLDESEIPELIGEGGSLATFSAKYNMSWSLEETVSELYHVHDKMGQACQRWDRKLLTPNLVTNRSLWTMTMPHPWLSGTCYTYK